VSFWGSTPESNHTSHGWGMVRVGQLNEDFRYIPWHPHGWRICEEVVLYRHGPEEASFLPGITYNIASIPQRNEVVNVTKKTFFTILYFIWHVRTHRFISSLPVNSSLQKKQQTFCNRLCSSLFNLWMWRTWRTTTRTIVRAKFLSGPSCDRGPNARFWRFLISSELVPKFKMLQCRESASHLNFSIVPISTSAVL